MAGTVEWTSESEMEEEEEPLFADDLEDPPPLPPPMPSLSQMLNTNVCVLQDDTAQIMCFTR